MNINLKRINFTEKVSGNSILCTIAGNYFQ